MSPLWYPLPRRASVDFPSPPRIWIACEVKQDVVRGGDCWECVLVAIELRMQRESWIVNQVVIVAIGRRWEFRQWSLKLKGDEVEVSFQLRNLVRGMPRELGQQHF